MLEDGLLIEIGSKIADHLRAAGVEEAELRRIATWSVARWLYRRKVLSLGLSAELAGVERAEFTAGLARDGVPLLDLPEEEASRELDLVDVLLRRRRPS